MSQSTKLFADLLTQAIHIIRLREGKSVQIVQDEFGYALERESGGSPIEYWRKGHIPKQADIQKLARQIIARSSLDREWLERFLHSAGYTDIADLCDELFPAKPLRADPKQKGSPTTMQTAKIDDVFMPELSPFVVGPPITHCRQFFGREEELKRIFGALSRFPLQNIAVIGLQRSGKTSLLHYLKQITHISQPKVRPNQRTNWLQQPERYKWIFVDFQDARMKSQEGLLHYLIDSLNLPKPEPCTLIPFMEVVSRNLQTPTVILMDEIGAALESSELNQSFWDSLRSLGTNQTNGMLSFIITAHQSPKQLASTAGKSSPFFNIFHHLNLGPLTEQAARELIANSPVAFDPSVVEWIIAQSGRWPALLQILCYTYLNAISEDVVDPEWRDEGLRHVEHFRYLLGGS